MTRRTRRARLLVLNQYYDTAEASGQLLRQLCEDLAADVEVEVIAGQPAEADAVRARAERRGVGLTLVRTTRLPKSSLVLRIVNYATFMAGVAVAAMRRSRPDVVMCMTDPPVVGIVAALAARFRGGKLLMVAQDVHPDAGVRSGTLTNPLAVWGLRQVQCYLLRRADHVVVIGEAMRRTLEQRTRDTGFTVIPNWADLEHVQPAARDNSWAVAQGLTAGFTVMHAGNVGMLQSLDSLLGAASVLPDVTFAIVGGGARKQQLEARALEAGLANVRFIPRQPDDRLPDVLASADVHVVSLMRGLAGLLEPSKVYGVLAAGRPVVAAVDDETETARLVRESGCGVVVAPSDGGALAAGIAEIRALPDAAREEMGAAARRMAERSGGRERASAAYLEVVSGLAGTRGQRVGDGVHEPSVVSAGSLR